MKAQIFYIIHSRGISNRRDLARASAEFFLLFFQSLFLNVCGTNFITFYTFLSTFGLEHEANGCDIIHR